MGCCVNHSLVNSRKQSDQSNVIVLKYSGTVILIFLSTVLISSATRWARLWSDFEIPAEKGPRQLS